MISVVGEALVDLLPIGATTFEATPGGSPANTAIALARQGIPVALLARLSTDGFGRQLRAHLQDNGVDLSSAVEAPEPSSVALVSRDGDGSASYRFLVDGTADWQWTDEELVLPADTVAVHAGSLALSLAPPVERLLRRAGCTVSIDPNLRPSMLPAAGAVDRWLALADIWKASAEDAALLHPGETPAQVARRWAAAGPALVLVTEGAGGVTAAVAGEVLHVPAPPTEVVDTVGAGDTFNAGLLAALHEAGHLGGRLSLTQEQLRPALHRALRAAAVTCSRPGADPPYVHELA